MDESLLQRTATDQGNAFAQDRIGRLYQQGGPGVARNYAEAMRWFRKAADQGYAVAQYDIGSLYENGWGVARDYAEAMRWFRKAADQGIAYAKDRLMDLEKMDLEQHAGHPQR